jgi:hypothetical protein
VAQVSSLWQQLLNQFQRLSQETVNLKTSKRLKIHRFRGPGGWLLSLTVVVAMLFWNWKLLLATSAGILVMVLVYLMQEWDWQVHWSGIRRFLNSSNRQLALAVGGGGVAAFSTYMAASIWVESDSPWMAVGAIFQGLGTLMALVLLIWQIVSRQASREEARLNGMLMNLTDSDPLKRLIAVRQLTHWGTETWLEPSHRRQIADYFCLMLNRESETTVRDAVLEGLQSLGNPQGRREDEPLQIPMNMKESVVKVQHRS